MLTPKSSSSDFPGAPQVQRIRHDLRVRSLTVQAVEHVTPRMLRIVLTGADLFDFATASFDDHVKLLVPGPDGAPVRRDYTPRRFDRADQTLTIDFALHEAGPATRWALGARRGDMIQVSGPKGSTVIPNSVRRWLMIGDETALPAIGRRIEEARPGERITTVIAVADLAERQSLRTKGNLLSLWAHRPPSMASDPTALLSLVRTIAVEAGTFVWIAAEAQVARAIRQLLLQERAHPRGWIKAAGYWAQGRADAGERIEDVVA